MESTCLSLKDSAYPDSPQRWNVMIWSELLE